MNWRTKNRSLIAKSHFDTKFFVCFNEIANCWNSNRSSTHDQDWGWSSYFFDVVLRLKPSVKIMCYALPVVSISISPWTAILLSGTQHHCVVLNFHGLVLGINDCHWIVIVVHFLQASVDKSDSILSVAQRLDSLLLRNWIIFKSTVIGCCFVIWTYEFKVVWFVNDCDRKWRTIQIDETLSYHSSGEGASYNNDIRCHVLL